VVQIIEMVTITPLPQVSNVVEGVINVRGSVIPVVNLRRHFGLPEATLQLHTPIILVEASERMIGLIVDEVIDVLSLLADQITRPASILPEGLGEAPLLQGLARTPHGMVLLLDLDHLFLPSQAQVLAQAVVTLPGDVDEEASEDVRVALVAAPEDTSSEAMVEEVSQESPV
ncbi:MAG: chemotaxis protein CheW, partial [Anaerolineae bacterium]